MSTFFQVENYSNTIAVQVSPEKIGYNDTLGTNLNFNLNNYPLSSDTLAQTLAHLQGSYPSIHQQMLRSLSVGTQLPASQREIPNETTQPGSEDLSDTLDLGINPDASSLDTGEEAVVAEDDGEDDVQPVELHEMSVQYSPPISPTPPSPPSPPVHHADPDSPSTDYDDAFNESSSTSEDRSEGEIEPIGFFSEGEVLMLPRMNEYGKAHSIPFRLDTIQPEHLAAITMGRHASDFYAPSKNLKPTGGIASDTHTNGELSEGEIPHSSSVQEVEDDGDNDVHDAIHNESNLV